MRALQQLLCWTVVLLAAGACTPGHGDAHGDAHGDDAADGHTEPAPAPDMNSDTLFPAKAPPFSAGIFPCSRCHEGGPEATDPGPFFPHAGHVAKGLECADCHFPDDEAEPIAADAELCQECHEEEDANSARAKEYFAAYADDDDGLAFPDRWRLRDVKPEHERHMEAEIECSACHGEASNEALIKPKPLELMDRCVSCHEERGIARDCATCHADTPVGAAGKFHDFELHHAEQQRGCLDCHNPDDRDTLRLAGGAAISFRESYRLCGQCHGPKLRDWKVGLHGKRIGSWDGVKEYLLCAHCHNPHSPAFGEMDVLPPPQRPEEMR